MVLMHCCSVPIATKAFFFSHDKVSIYVNEVSEWRSFIVLVNNLQCLDLIGGGIG